MSEINKLKMILSFSKFFLSNLGTFCVIKIQEFLLKELLVLFLKLKRSFCGKKFLEKVLVLKLDLNLEKEALTVKRLYSPPLVSNRF